MYSLLSLHEKIRFTKTSSCCTTLPYLFNYIMQLLVDGYAKAVRSKIAVNRRKLMFNYCNCKTAVIK